MASPAEQDDTHVRPADLSALPAVYAQQVMSPSGVAAQGPERREAQQPTMNGVGRSVVATQGDHDDEAFRRALEEVSRTRRDVTTYRNRRDRYTAKQCFRECRQCGSYVYS